MPAPVKPIAETVNDDKPALVSKLSTKLKDRILDEVEYNQYAGDGFELDDDDVNDAITKPIAPVSSSLNRLQTKDTSKSALGKKYTDLYQAKPKVDTWNTNISSPIRKIIPLKKSALDLEPKMPPKPKLSAEEIKRQDEER